MEYLRLKAPPVEVNTSSSPGHRANVHPELGLDTPVMQFADHDVDATETRSSGQLAATRTTGCWNREEQQRYKSSGDGAGNR